MTDQVQSAVWIKVCALKDVPTNRARGFSINGQPLVVARCGDVAYITQGTCSHMWYPLPNSRVEGCIVTCGLHRSSFNITDGSVENWGNFPPIVGEALADIRKSKALHTYPTKIDNGEVFIEWPGSDPSTARVKF